jgi:hypothetical protein
MAQTNGKTKKTDSVATIKGLTGKDYMQLDGRRYLLAPIDSYGLHKRAQLTELIRRVDELERAAALRIRAKQDLDPADEREYHERMLEVAHYALPTLPKAKKLTPGECQQISGAFFLWLARTQSALFEAARWTMRSSLLGSPTPTAEANG